MSTTTLQSEYIITLKGLKTRYILGSVPTRRITFSDSSKLKI